MGRVDEIISSYRECVKYPIKCPLWGCETKIKNEKELTKHLMLHFKEDLVKNFISWVYMYKGDI